MIAGVVHLTAMAAGVNLTLDRMEAAIKTGDEAVLYDNADRVVVIAVLLEKSHRATGNAGVLMRGIARRRTLS